MSDRPVKQFGVMVIACVAVLAIGVVAMKAIASLRTPPTQVKTEERTLQVEVREAVPQDVTVQIAGTGVVRSLNEVAIAPEVGGKVISVYPDLEVGQRVPRGAVLFQIDPVDYEARVTDAKATVALWENTVARLQKQYETDRQRLETLERSRNLARTEFERVKELFESDEVGTRSGVDQSERAYNSVSDQADQLAQAVALYPNRIQEAQSSLASARAQLTLAESSLDRTQVHAPFDGRVKAVSVETGQYVMPGGALLTLADDSVLEISVPLDSREARRWLQFDDATDAAQGASWFSNLEQTPCTIRWTEDRENHVWTGTLHRVEKFDESTRTLTVAVRVERAQAFAEKNGGFPLVEGMFCSVSIPGKTLENVYEVPSSAVTFEGTVYTVSDGRLKTVPVEVAYSRDDRSYVTGGLAAGSQIIVTRLVNPLEHTLVEPVTASTESAS